MARAGGQAALPEPGAAPRTEQAQDDGEPFDGKITRLAAEISQQFAESAKLEKEIRKNLASLDFPMEDHP